MVAAMKRNLDEIKFPVPNTISKLHDKVCISSSTLKPRTSSPSLAGLCLLIGGTLLSTTHNRPIYTLDAHFI